MNLPLRFAFRYLKTSRKNVNFISIISAISLLGIAVGVASLICVMSIFNGFRDLLQSMLIGYDPHIRVTAPATRSNSSLLTLIRNQPDVKAASDVVQGRVIVIKGGNSQVFMLNGVKSDEIDGVSGVKDAMSFGKFEIRMIDNFYHVVIGTGVADKLRAMPGDTLTLLSPSEIESAAVGFYRPKGLSAIVAGVFQSNAKEYDQFYLYGSQELGHKLFAPKKIFIDIRLHDLQNVQSTAQNLTSILPTGVQVETWFDLHKELYGIMQFERLVSFSIISIIVLVAVFNILASLSMSVVQKQRDIALLKAIGARNRLIRNIFLAEGVIIGLIAVTAGVALGLGLCLGQQEFGWFGLDRSKYIISAIPVSVYSGDVIVVCVLALLLCFGATIYPAHRAATTLISRALREQ
ncbi:MAG: ABC transporter permease [Ignavibacteria bacterium]|nr:ABC transporter permease [Ignavibacteria bacterium]